MLLLLYDVLFFIIYTVYLSHKLLYEYVLLITDCYLMDVKHAIISSYDWLEGFLSLHFYGVACCVIRYEQHCVPFLFLR